MEMEDLGLEPGTPTGDVDIPSGDIMAALYVPPTIPSSWSIYAIHGIKWLLRDKDTRFLIFSRLCSFSLLLPCDEGNV